MHMEPRYLATVTQTENNFTVRGNLNMFESYFWPEDGGLGGGGVRSCPPELTVWLSIMIFNAKRWTKSTKEMIPELMKTVERMQMEPSKFCS